MEIFSDCGINTEIIQITIMLAAFCIMGTIGNTLVIYVYSKQKHSRQTSNVFIMSLAAGDLLASCLSMPLTIIYELSAFHVNIIFCNFYYFIMPSIQPFSILLMVGIAVDRYLCICHPFLRLMTNSRAKIVVVACAIVAFIEGIFVMLCHGIKDMMHGNVQNYTGNNSCDSTLDNEPICDVVETIFKQNFVDLYARFHASCFIGSVVIASFLYILIYITVIKQRALRRKIKSGKIYGAINGKKPKIEIIFSSEENTCRCAEVTVVPEENEHSFDIQQETEITHNKSYENRVSINQANQIKKPNLFVQLRVKTNLKRENKSGSCKSNKENKRKPIAQDKCRNSSIAPPLSSESIQNIRTAIMLSVVTIVFVLCYAPPMLTIFGLMPQLGGTFYYVYFAFNVSNPVIYCFMNRRFRADCARIFRCKRA